MQNNVNLVVPFPLPSFPNRKFDLTKGQIYINFFRDIFIWGIVFKKDQLTKKTKMKLQIHNWRDSHIQNVPFSNGKWKWNHQWQNPDGSDAQTPLELEFDPADMDDAGCIFFKQPSDPTKIMSFIASSVKIMGVSGDLKIMFDFVGTSIAYEGAHGILNKDVYDLRSVTKAHFAGNIFYTGQFNLL